MATRKRSILPGAAITSVLGARRWALAAGDELEVLGGSKGRLEDRALRVSDLVDVGVIGIANDRIYSRVGPEPKPLYERRGRPGGITADVDVIQTSDGSTITMDVDDGEVAGFTGDFDAVRVDVSPPATHTFTVATGGLVTPTNCRFDALIDGQTRTVVVTNARMRQML